MINKTLTSFEKRVLWGLFFVGIISFIFFVIFYVHMYGKSVPDYGGTYKEGVVGQPQFINPVLSDINDVNRDISELVFSGLLKYDGDGNLINDLAKDYSISEDGKIYMVNLRENVFWHDGQNFTADDVIFTIKSIQDPTLKSPLAINWYGIKIEKINDYALQFDLENPYSPFIESLTVGIIPKHIWSKIAVNNFSLSEFNLKPVGTGPYKFVSFQKEKSGMILSYDLARNERYYEKPAFIEKIIFYFFPTEDKALSELNSGMINGMSSLSIKNRDALTNSDIIINKISLFRYFAVFFNQSQNRVLSEKEVRQALGLAINKQEIIEGVFHNDAVAVNFPIPENLNITPLEYKGVMGFSQEKAASLLEKEGWKIKEGDEFRSKKLTPSITKDFLGKRPDTTVATLADFTLEIDLMIPELAEFIKIGEIIKRSWEAIGVKTNLKFIPAQTQENLQDVQQQYIRPRNYQALLFGHVFLSQPDLFSFWYSSQKKDPGLNLSLYDNKEIDKLLDDIRQTVDPKKRVLKLNNLQALILDDAPAIFLYNPYYLYPTSSQIKGIDIKNIVLPSKRFSQVENWYISTKTDF